MLRNSCATASPLVKMRSGSGIDADQPGELQHRGAGIEEDRRARRQQPVGGGRDRALGGDVALGALLEGQFDRRALRDARTAVNAVDSAVPFEDLQVAPDGRQRGADRVGQRLNGRKAVGVEMAADGVETFRFHAPCVIHRLVPHVMCA